MTIRFAFAAAGAAAFLAAAPSALASVTYGSATTTAQSQAQSSISGVPDNTPLAVDPEGSSTFPTGPIHSNASTSVFPSTDVDGTLTEQLRASNAETAVETFLSPSSGTVAFTGNSSIVIQPTAVSPFGEAFGDDSSTYSFSVDQTSNFLLGYAVSATGDGAGGNYYATLVGSSGNLFADTLDNVTGTQFALLAPGSYELELSSFNSGGPITASPDFLSLSSAGSVSETAAGNFTFDISALPEPRAWAMMLIGAFAVGGALRANRRRRLAVLAAAR